jgi:hypothetical protein
MKKKIALSDEKIIDNIHIVRGQKIMLDRDLALLYDVPTKVLKQAVKRNKSRFPSDFMFKMTSDEFRNWRSQFVTSNFSLKMGLRYAPFCFTEHGVAMLSSILNSKKAIEVNIRIIRIFTRIREAILSNKDILSKIDKLEKKVYKNDDDIRNIFIVLKQLLIPPSPPRKKIGFKRYD